MKSKAINVRNMVLILGDQLDEPSEALTDFEPACDVIAMAEVKAESEYVWSHKMRTTLFFSAMRHFADHLRSRHYRVLYHPISSPSPFTSLAEVFKNWAQELRPEKIIVVEPGEWRLLPELKQMSSQLGIPLEIRQDRTFLCSLEEFSQYASDKKQLRMEFFYRYMRKKKNILMQGDKPVGGQWNFDQENRKSFGKNPPVIKKHPHFPPDETTQQAMRDVAEHFPHNPGENEAFDWPVTSDEAARLLDFFITHYLPVFGQWQDAMWTNEAFLFHSRLSAAMNLKLIHPLTIIKRVEKAYEANKAPLASCEGFIRQILGWREYVRGIYFLSMPQYLERNTLKAKRKLPQFYWTGQTPMECLKQTVGQTLKYGYAHHIQRLMVTGLYALLAEVNPKEVHQWYLAIYVDAVEWVELPNTLGMSQYADGGVMASKPYIATGKYISRMSNYCRHCPFDPDKAYGEDACPYTTLYWHFVDKHQDLLAMNPRLGMQLKNWQRKKPQEQKQILQQAKLILQDKWPAMTRQTQGEQADLPLS